MKIRSIVSILAVLFVLVLALTSCDAITGLFKPSEPPHEHTWEEATCTAPKTCTECDATEGEPLGHTEEIVPGKAATCTEAGYTEGKICTVCGDITVAQEPIPAGHTEKVVEGHAATCTATGLTDGKVCSVCGTTLVAQEEIPLADHTEEVVAGQAATCTATGLTDGKKCSVCDEILLAQEEIPLADHTDEVVAGKAATCTENGLTDGKKCSVCDETLLAQEVIPAGHVDENNDYKCDACGKALCKTHTPSEPIIEDEVPASCTEPGSYTKIINCTVCGEEISRTQETITAPGHAYGEITYEWSADNTVCTAKQVCATDSSHVISETRKIYQISLQVTAEKVTYTYAVKFDNAGYAAQEKTATGSVEIVDGLAKIVAPTVEGRMASHEYVMFDLHDEAAEHDFVITYSKYDVWDGTTATAFASGSGTENDPYIIMTGAQLAYLAKLGMDGTTTDSPLYGTGIYYKLGASLDLTVKSWTPIAMYDTGYKWTYFDGNFDGAGQRIIININTTGYGYGLFAGLGASSVVKNLNLSGTVAAAHRAGALAYITQSGAIIENVVNYVNVTTTSTSACYTGGLIGSFSGAESVMRNCVNYGTVTTKGSQTGGLTGTVAGTIKNSVNYGLVVSSSTACGGISGVTVTATIQNCVNYGKVEGAGNTGGVIGNITTASKLTGCVNYGLVNGKGGNVGGVGGYLGAGGVISDCVNYGAVANTSDDTAGILGENQGSVEKSVNYGKVYGQGKNVGGIVGYYGKNTASTSYCENYGDVSGDSTGVGGIVGDSTTKGGTVENCTDHTAE